jgi:hypothetical protein
MGEWKPIESAPRGCVPFLALNEDRECHVAAYDKDGRLMRRSHQQRFPQSFVVEGGKKVLVSEGFEFNSDWSLWTKGYDFKPTHWLPLPAPPSQEEG